MPGLFAPAALLPLLHQPLLFFEGGVDFVVDPPAGQRVLRAAQEDLVPEPNAVVDLLIDVIAREQLLFIEPAADTAALERIVHPPGERLVFVAVADEAGVH